MKESEWYDLMLELANEAARRVDPKMTIWGGALSSAREHWELTPFPTISGRAAEINYYGPDGESLRPRIVRLSNGTPGAVKAFKRQVTIAIKEILRERRAAEKR